VNGQVFHSDGFGYTLLAHPRAVRRIVADRRWDPEELARVFPETLGARLEPPVGTGLGARVDEEAAQAWQPLAPGQRFWCSPRE